MHIKKHTTVTMQFYKSTKTNMYSLSPLLGSIFMGTVYKDPGLILRVKRTQAFFNLGDAPTGSTTSPRLVDSIETSLVLGFRVTINSIMAAEAYK